jgi:hypothetical protein
VLAANADDMRAAEDGGLPAKYAGSDWTAAG